ncbi:Branchless trichome [Thalictrum thalictroides]|uniref:Branchless trichome n=1 Tax=Thalictrum thalictroides TaxID=46969 RepID=A0A7J6VXC2_THATH|nr:Branchless trichome [Thalictrum thalictroides]
MDSELDMARAKIHELKAQLEFERKTRKKLETFNKKLCKQLSEERKRKQAVEDVCQKLAREIASEKGEMDRIKKDIVEERKMLRVAEVLREERVQMKLSEAKILFEEKLSQLSKPAATNMEHHTVRIVTSNEPSTTMTDQNSNTITSNNHHLVFVGSALNKRRASPPEAENPHIKRGIKGFVEFPRVVRAISSRGRQLGSKVECQKAQLRLLLRHKSPFPSENLVMG